ncbi:DUF6958 family protein [Bacillus sp. FJAT-27225]|uniref:DUF6958 family protein n=1 Tax=Bacillus sp. FJAT-27225 TaxID=1743144 RepID=UPI003F8AED65
MKKGRLKDSFDGSPSWYCTAVKLDLESRGLLERLEDKGPQRIRLKKSRDPSNNVSDR